MIKQLLSIAALTLTVNAFSQTFSGLYHFTGVVGNTSTLTPTGTTDPTTVPSATGVVFGSFTAVGTSTASSGNGRFSFSNWPTGSTTGNDVYSTYTGAIDVNKYYSVTVSPAANYSITLSSIVFDARRSGTGIRNFSVRSSADNYATNLPSAVPTSTNPIVEVLAGDLFFWKYDTTNTGRDQKSLQINLSGANFTNVSTGLGFRFYGWNAEASTGTFSIDSVKFNGSATLSTGFGNVSFDLNSSLSVYPVPSNDGQVTVDIKGYNYSSIQVFDVLGNLVSTEIADKSTASKANLNLASLPNGNYFVRVKTDAGIVTRKITLVK